MLRCLTSPLSVLTGKKSKSSNKKISSNIPFKQGGILRSLGAEKARDLKDLPAPPIKRPASLDVSRLSSSEVVAAQ